MNKNIEKIFESNNINKTNIIKIIHSNDSIKPQQLFLRHLSSVMHDGVKYRIILDSIQFNTFFITKEIKEFEINE